MQNVIGQDASSAWHRRRRRELTSLSIVALGTSRLSHHQKVDEDEEIQDEASLTDFRVASI